MGKRWAPRFRTWVRRFLRRDARTRKAGGEVLSFFVLRSSFSTPQSEAGERRTRNHEPGTLLLHPVQRHGEILHDARLLLAVEMRAARHAADHLFPARHGPRIDH